MNIADKISTLESNQKNGTLKFFGEWFGRPMDNYHVLTNSVMDDTKLILTFENGEVLEVWDPENLVVDGVVTTIQNALRVKWSWFSYGKPKLKENIMFYEFQVLDGELHSKTNSPWPLKACIKEAAVQIV